MIRRVEVRGFKSLRSVSVELGAVNVFIGANGTGKSNLLEAVGIVGAAISGSVTPASLRDRGVRPGREALYKSSFKGSRHPRIIHLEVENDAASYRVGLDNPIKGNKGDMSPWGIQSETLVSEGAELLTRSPRGANAHVGGAHTKLSPRGTESAVQSVLQQIADETPARLLRDRLEGFAIFTPTTAVLRGLGKDEARYPVGLCGSNLAAAVTALIHSINRQQLEALDADRVWELVDWADGMRTVPAREASVSPAVGVEGPVLEFHDKFMAKGRDMLSAYDASEGALYVLFLLVLAAHADASPFFSVDNFDHGLHPRLAAQLMKTVADLLIEQPGKQMMLTTHNPLVLDGLDLRDDAVRLFAVERARAGATNGTEPRAVGETVIRRVELDTKLLDEIDGSGLSLSRLWMMGRLGAVPSL